MKYAINTKKKKSKAHIWDDGDTYCRMYSTGGMKKKKVEVFESTTREICQMCKNVWNKFNPLETIE